MYPPKQTQPLDELVTESWSRDIPEPGVRDIHGVGASRLQIDEKSYWQIAVHAMEFVREDPLETELREKIAQALRTLEGVTRAAEEDRETWLVFGEPSGQALVEAVSRAIDAYANEIAVVVRGLTSA
ncbi:MAG: hypothetical protein QM831_22375 [Kofleriaceae bacterium]